MRRVLVRGWRVVEGRRLKVDVVGRSLEKIEDKIGRRA